MRGFAFESFQSAPGSILHAPTGAPVRGSCGAFIRRSSLFAVALIAVALDFPRARAQRSGARARNRRPYPIRLALPRRLGKHSVDHGPR